MKPDFNPTAIERLATSLFVVLVKVPVDDPKFGRVERLSLVASPGEDKPWYHRNRRVADLVAKEHDGMACTWKEAFAMLLKENPGFHDELIERVSRAKYDSLKHALDQNSLKHGINTNPHRASDGTILGSDGKPVEPPQS